MNILTNMFQNISSNQFALIYIKIVPINNLYKLHVHCIKIIYYIQSLLSCIYIKIVVK